LRTNEEDWTPVFACYNDDCPNGWEKDGIYIDSERLIDYYRFKIYEDTEYLDQAKEELPKEEWCGLVAEWEEMKRLFENRPYQAVPSVLYI